MRRRVFLGTVAATPLAGCGEFRGTGSDGVGEDVPTEDPPPALEGPDGDGTVDDFADLEGWTVRAGRASLDDTGGRVGDQAVRLTADAADDQARLGRRLPEPIDWSGTTPGLAIATEEPVRPTIQLFDESGNVIDFRARVDGGDLRRCQFGIAGIDAEADPGAITEIHVAFFAGDETERTLLLDDLHLVSRPADGRVMIHFDGGYESVYDEARPLLEAYDVPATAFVPTDLIREEATHEGDRLTESQLETLADDGWTIASYGTNGRPLPDLEGPERTDHLVDARRWLEDEGYADGARFVSYPNGRYDEASLEQVDDAYELGFAFGAPVQAAVVDPDRYPRVPAPDPETAATHLDRTADLGGVTTLCYFDVDAEAVDRLEETLAHLDDRVAAGDLEVVTPDDLAR